MILCYNVKAMKKFISILSVLLTIVIFCFSCEKKEKTVFPFNLEASATIVGTSNDFPNGDGSGKVIFTMSANNAEYFEVYIPTNEETLTLYNKNGGEVSYAFDKNGDETTTYKVYVTACNSSGNTTNELSITVYYAMPESDVQLWETNPSDSIYFERQSVALNFTASGNNSYNTITVVPSDTYQEVDGFGFALTKGSAVLLAGLSETNRNEILNELFATDSTNIGVSYLRISLGASDLNSEPYSYDNIEGDSTLEHFSIAIEDDDLVPILQQIIQINPDIKILASPWSAPTWMKTNNAYVDGSLKTECHEVYAQYFVEYIQAMADRGITISAITPQNEPLYQYNNPSMYMPAEEENEFIKNYLYPAFQANNINTQIIVWDHNLDNIEYAKTILSDPVTYDMIAGSAFHAYAGDISALTTLHNLYPNKNVYFTEQYTASTGNFEEDIVWHLKNLIIGAPRNWSKNVIEWNLASDPSMGPHTDGGCSTCLGGITIRGENVTKRNVSYYIVAHASKFVRPGALRIDSTDYSDLPNIAYKNLDGSIVVIVLNYATTAQTFNIKYNGQTFTSTLDGGAVGTYIW
jgi:glucosylceramidase